MCGGVFVKEKVLKFLKGKNSGKILAAVGIIGILLIYGSTLISPKEEKLPQSEDLSCEEYCAEIEAKVGRITSALCGDASAVITVTLDTGVRYEYADETKKNDAEEDSRTTKESEKTYITVKDSSGGEKPLLITSYMPEIRGVTVICRADEATAEEIKAAVTAALDISSRKIYVGRKQQ